MATHNSYEFDISGAIFKPISSENKSSRRHRKRPYKSAHVAPAICPEKELDERYVQVPMYERWADDYQPVKIVSSISKHGEIIAPKASYPQVPMYERWNW
jgi:hypothetical protein